MDPIFLARVEDSKLIVQNKEMWAQYIYSLNGKQVEVSVKKRRRKRTSGKSYEEGDQNGWYWSTIIPISGNALGNTNDEMHEIFLQEFAPYRIKNGVAIIDGKVKIVSKRYITRTSQMDTVQFSEYCESIIRAMAELNIIIPYPHERIQ